MIETLIWAAVALILGGVTIWRACYYVDAYLGYRLKAQETTPGEKETAMMERRTAAELASRTVEPTAALKQAELERKTAEARAATALIDELKPDRLAAERAIIAARVAAEEELATEFVRRGHEHDKENVVSLYERYMKTCRDSNVLSPLDLPDFIDTLQNTDQI